MSKFEGFSLGSLAADGAGSAVEVSHLEDVAILVTGTFVADWKLQVSFDGTNWQDHPTLLKTDDTGMSGAVGFPCKQLRVVLANRMSGTVVARGGGVNKNLHG